jgi:hypothetical protein
VAWLRRRLDFASDFPLLEAGRGDVRQVAGELFDTASALAPGFEVLERSAPDIPELLALFLALRRGLIDRLTRFIENRSPEAGDPGVTARLILEAALWGAQRRRRDRESRGVSADAARAGFVRLAERSLAPG